MKRSLACISLCFLMFPRLFGQTNTASGSKPNIDLSFLSPTYQKELKELGFVTSFRMKPEGLELVPNFSDRETFISRHEKLQAHAVQEALFILPARRISTERAQLYQLLQQAPTLAGLSYTRKRGGPVLLFRKVQFVSPPNPETLEAVIQVEDTEFGTIKFKTQLEFDNTKIILKMINLDPLSYLVFPAVPPGQALVDIVYGMDKAASFVYTAWSVRAYLFIPSAAAVETPLYRRAISLKNWFVNLLETLP